MKRAADEERTAKRQAVIAAMDADELAREWAFARLAGAFAAGRLPVEAADERDWLDRLTTERDRRNAERAA